MDLITGKFVEIKKKSLRFDCPKCGKERYYTQKAYFNRAIRKPNLCQVCTNKIIGKKRKIVIPEGGWKRKCSSCNREIKYKKRGSLNDGIKNNTQCPYCHNLGKHIMPHSEETRKNIAERTKEMMKEKGYTPEIISKLTKEGMKNIPIYSKQKMIIVHLGKKLSDETKRKIGLKSKGRHHTEDTKRNKRIFQLKRIEKLGILPNEDKGAKEFFEHMNRTTGYNFKQKSFIDVGYRADGYDEEKHIWCEFDTPYHNQLRQQKKDTIRQQNIIEHFEKEGNPLNLFIRVKADKDGKVLGTRCVYSKPILTKGI